MPAWERGRGAFSVSTDPGRLDLDMIHGYLTRSYWAAGVPREVVARSVEGALCFGLFEQGGGALRTPPRPAASPPSARSRVDRSLADRQIGFARVITDRATYAYLADVFVLEERRGQGLGVWLMECVMAHPDLQGLRRWSLVTRDAHGLYRRFGFTGPAAPERYMEKVQADIYTAAGGGER
jgi:ribosomal protein S18 acetylase RimI-like enzyme